MKLIYCVSLAVSLMVFAGCGDVDQVNTVAEQDELKAYVAEHGDQNDSIEE